MRKGFWLVLALAVSSMAFADLPKAVTSATEDLNGDGIQETISIADMTAAGAFVLHAGNVSIKGQLKEKPDGFSIVDIDTADSYKEIDVWVHGDSDYDDHFLYWYDGKAIQPMQRLVRWPEFSGNGIVLVKDSMEFWMKTEKYLLEKKTHSLTFVPQELYAVEVTARVLTSFPIYTTRNSSTVVANLKTNSNATILVCGNAPGKKTTTEGASPKEWEWYLIKSESGLTGWAKLPTFRKKLELTWFDW